MVNRSLKDQHLKGKAVLVRVDYNVPLKEGEISDDTRIRASLPTLQWLIGQGARVIVMSHLGRPKGEEPSLSLAPVAKRLGELLGQKVYFGKDPVDMKEGEVQLLENLRFDPGEKGKDPAFVKALAERGDVYVNDAFGTCHRQESSVYGLAQAFAKTGNAFPGLLLQKEIEAFDKLLNHPDRPFAAVIGGAKISTKLGVLDQLMKKVDLLLIGGAMANTLLLAQGFEVGASLVEEECLEPSQELLQKAEERGVELLLPVDLVVTRDQKESRISSLNEVAREESIVDIGPKTVELFAGALEKAKTVLWNGPLGLFEIPPFNLGSLEVGRTIANLPAYVVVGGGDTIACVKQLGLEEAFSHLSTGGGAALELVEKGTLPGLDVLYI